MSDWNYAYECVESWLQASKSLYHKQVTYGIDLMPEIFAVEDGALEYICGSNHRQSEIILSFYNDHIDFDTAYNFLLADDDYIDRYIVETVGEL